MMTGDLRPLKGLKNIGPTIAQRLAAVGVVTVADLLSVGVANTYRRMQVHNPEVTLPVCYYLYALEAALQDCHWQELPAEVRTKLRLEAKAARYWSENLSTHS